MINFSATSSTADSVHYYNYKGETVKTLSVSDLEDYVIAKGYNVVINQVLIYGSGMPCDPNNEFEEEISELMAGEYLDSLEQVAFAKLTTEFYNHLNPSEYKANGHPNQLNSKKL